MTLDVGTNTTPDITSTVGRTGFDMPNAPPPGSVGDLLQRIDNAPTITGRAQLMGQLDARTGSKQASDALFHYTESERPILLAKADTGKAVVNEPEIGSLSAKHETGARGPATVSTGKGDRGGVSYGSYQLASKMGQTEAFFANEGKQWQSECAGLKSGTPTFSNAWRSIAARQPEALHLAEHAFIQRTHYQVTVDHVVAHTGYDIGAHSATLRDVVWSTSVQHGGETRIVDRAVASVDKMMKRSDPRFERSLIEAVYAERGRQDTKGVLVYFPSSPDNWPGLKARFKAENTEALKRLDTEMRSH